MTGMVVTTVQATTRGGRTNEKTTKTGSGRVTRTYAFLRNETFGKRIAWREPDRGISGAQPEQGRTEEPNRAVNGFQQGTKTNQNLVISGRHIATIAARRAITTTNSRLKGTKNSRRSIWW